MAASVCLSFKVNSQTELVATLVKIFAINHCVEGESDAGTKGANESKTDHILVVDTSLTNASN